MPVRTYRTKVMVPDGFWDEQHPPQAFVEKPAYNFRFTAKNHDEAREIARTRLEQNGLKIRSVAHGERETVIVTVLEGSGKR